jgi:hypothetical protein
VGLPPEELQSASQHCDRRDEEQANAHGDLACEKWVAFDFRLLA